MTVSEAYEAADHQKDIDLLNGQKEDGLSIFGKAILAFAKKAGKPKNSPFEVASGLYMQVASWSVMKRTSLELHEAMILDVFQTELPA